MIFINFKKVPAYLFAASLILSGGSLASAASADSSMETKDTEFDFVQKAQEQGYTAEAKDLKQYIQEKANADGKTYDEIANEIFTEVQRIHAEHSDQPIYNDLITNENSAPSALNSQNAIPLSAVTQAFVTTEATTATTRANQKHLLKKTETIVSGGLNIQYGVDSVIYSSGSFRQFVSINASTAFVMPSGSGTHNWSPAYQTATLVDSQNVNFRAYGNLESTVSKSVSAGFSAAGFSISSTTGTTVTLRKSHQIDHTFTLY